MMRWVALLVLDALLDSLATSRISKEAHTRNHFHVGHMVFVISKENIMIVAHVYTSRTSSFTLKHCFTFSFCE